MAHTPDMATVTLQFMSSNVMGTSCRFLKVEDDQDTSLHIATSQIDYGDFDPDKHECGTVVDVEIPVWLAMKEGLV